MTRSLQIKIMEDIKNKMDQMRAIFIKNLKSKNGRSEIGIFYTIIAVVAVLGAINIFVK